MIIAIESASSDPSLALASADGEAFAADGWTGEGRQASELLPRLLVLLARAGRELREATALAVGVGPGSFTGLRVSMSLAKGMALALRVPLVGVPSLTAWLEAEPRAGGAVARAGAQDAYLLMRGEVEPRIVAAAELAGLVEGSPLAAPSELAAAFDLPRDAAATRGGLGGGAARGARLSRRSEGGRPDDARAVVLRAPRGTSRPRR